jgi:hypothetical protein
MKLTLNETIQYAQTHSIGNSWTILEWVEFHKKDDCGFFDVPEADSDKNFCEWVNDRGNPNRQPFNPQNAVNLDDTALIRTPTLLNTKGK